MDVVLPYSGRTVTWPDLLAASYSGLGSVLSGIPSAAWETYLCLDFKIAASSSLP